jgi:hypothetical protein
MHIISVYSESKAHFSSTCMIDFGRSRSDLGRHTKKPDVPMSNVGFAGTIMVRYGTLRGTHVGRSACQDVMI